MHTPSFVQLLASGLVATSAVAGFETPSFNGLSARHVASLIALAGPAFAAPVLEGREPHHAGKKTNAKGKNNARDEELVELEAREPHHAGKKTNAKGKNGARDVEDELETREPHHAGKKTNAKGKNGARDVDEVADLETREPHHAGVSSDNPDLFCHTRSG